MHSGYFDPARRALEKQAARERDDRLLAEGKVSASELRRRNGMFAAFDLSASSVFLRPDRYAG